MKEDKHYSRGLHKKDNPIAILISCVVLIAITVFDVGANKANAAILYLKEDSNEKLSNVTWDTEPVNSGGHLAIDTHSGTVNKAGDAWVFDTGYQVIAPAEGSNSVGVNEFFPAGLYTLTENGQVGYSFRLRYTQVIDTNLFPGAGNQGLTVYGIVDRFYSNGGDASPAEDKKFDATTNTVSIQPFLIPDSRFEDYNTGDAIKIPGPTRNDPVHPGREAPGTPNSDLAQIGIIIHSPSEAVPEPLTILGSVTALIFFGAMVKKRS